MDKYMDNNMRVVQAYKASGLSYSELSELLHIPRNTLACYITGRRTPNKITVEHIERTVKAFLTEKNISQKGRERIVSVSGDGKEYINKAQAYDQFTSNVSDVFDKLELPEQEKSVLKEDVFRAFDALPTISFNVTTVIEYEQNVKSELSK